MILSSRAHAWPEVWVDGLGWFPMDVAPQTYLDPPIPPPDYDLQSMLAEMAREEGEEYEQIREIDFRQLLNRLLSAIGAFIPWLVAGLLFLAYGIKLERRCRPMFEKDEAKVHAYYLSALDRAHDAGIARRRGQGRLAFAEEHSKEIPSLVPLTRAHLDYSFGRKGSAQVDFNELSDQFSKYNQELSRAVPLWRRVLGASNPFSWIFIK